MPITKSQMNFLSRSYLFGPTSSDFSMSLGNRGHAALQKPQRSVVVTALLRHTALTLSSWHCLLLSLPP